jgi:hypothetical protein
MRSVVTLRQAILMNADESPSEEQHRHVRGPERDCNSCRAHLINVGTRNFLRKKKL